MEVGTSSFPTSNHFPGRCTASYLARGVWARNTRRLPDPSSAFRRQQIDAHSQGRVESCGHLLRHKTYRQKNSKPFVLIHVCMYVLYHKKTTQCAWLRNNLSHFTMYCSNVIKNDVLPTSCFCNFCK